ncbi:unnamed protein product [Anisakis simplex]|uniref:Secreted protein n=1 Tax=Anisakis simplex TaxID=6269 RepID=A0A0M3JY73_ANISI|nr:unnamed protein product [Anisakis simplex]
MVAGLVAATSGSTASFAAAAAAAAASVWPTKPIVQDRISTGWIGDAKMDEQTKYDEEEDEDDDRLLYKLNDSTSGDRFYIWMD